MAPTRSMLFLLAAFGLAVGGCAGGAMPPPSASPNATAAESDAPSLAPTVSAATPLATPAAKLAADEVAYQATDPLLRPGVFDIYTPGATGSSPVVVMFHGTPSEVWKEGLAEHALRVAELGFVVFVADWGHLPPFAPEPDMIAYATASNAQVSCALAFAATAASRYGGDPQRLILFGYSGGSNVGSVVVFNNVPPSDTCLGGPKAAAVDALVTFDGNYLGSPDFDPVLRAEPEFFDLFTPWKALRNRPELPVALLASESPGANVTAPMPSALVASFLALRDWDGTLARLIEKVHPFDDGLFDARDTQAVMFEGFKENGNPVTFDVLPGSSHEHFGLNSWPVFLAAFGKVLSEID